MRKRTINHIYISFIWLIVCLLPLLYYLIINIKSGVITLDFATCLNQFGISTNNVIYSSLTELFGSDNDAIIHFFNNNSPVLLYLVYIVNITFLRIVVDILLFLPNLAVSLLEKVGGSINGKE